MNASKLAAKRGVWVATLVVAYLVSVAFWGWVALAPAGMMLTLWHAPAGLFRIAGIPVLLFPDPRPAAIEAALPWIHAAFWLTFAAVLIYLRRMRSKTAASIYLIFSFILILNLGGCFLISRS